MLECVQYSDRYVSSLIAFSLEAPQAILKFMKVSDIVIVLAGLEFILFTHDSVHLDNVVSGVENQHIIALAGVTSDDIAVFMQCVQRIAFVFRLAHASLLCSSKVWAHSAHADTSFCFKTSRSRVTKHHLSSKQTRSNSALILLI